MKKNIFTRIAALISGAAICVSGSTALSGTAVDESGSSIYSLGDVNGDGFVNASDASDVLVYYSLVSTGGSDDSWTEERLKAGDVDTNGMVDASDASFILMYYSYVSTKPSYMWTKSVYEYMNEVLSVEFPWTEEYYNYKPRQKYDLENNTVTLSWKKAYDVNGREADGYRVYISTPGEYMGDFVNVLYDERQTETSFVLELPEDYVKNGKDGKELEYDITPYSKVNEYISEAGYCYYDTLSRASVAVNTAKLKPHDTYPLYNIKGDKPYKSGNYTVTAADKKIMDKFAAEHFTEDMTNYEKLECTWRWLWENVTYADGKDGRPQYSAISGCSWVQACFEKKAGQCIQYNGALAEMLAYMGYDVYMMEMWVDKPNKAIQHFRAEITIDGQAYGIEVGNKGNTGSWTWFMTPIESSIIF